MKKHSRMTWTSYETVRYRNSSGSFTCHNTECALFLKYDKANKIHFTKTGACKICSFQDDWYSCDARKFIAFISDLSLCYNKAHVFHYGNHSCDAKLASTRPTDLVQKAVSADPNTRLAEIQSNVILSDLCSKKGWEEVNKTAKKVKNIRNLSNENVKPKKMI